MNSGTPLPQFKRFTLVRELEILVIADQRQAAERVMASLGTVHATTADDALSLRLKPDVSYAEAVRALSGSKSIRFVYCHPPEVHAWKANATLSEDAKTSLEAAMRDFAAVAESDRVAKGQASQAPTGGNILGMPANPIEEQFVVPIIPGQQYYVPPLVGYSQWREEGPRGFAGFGTYCSGRVDCIAFHPADPQIFYVGSNTGGLWRTADGGTTYTPLSDRWDSLEILAVAVDGSQSLEKVFVAKAGSEPGLLKSEDGGTSFQPVPGILASKTVLDIYILPDNPNIVLAAVSEENGHIYRSVNGGQTFDPVPADAMGNSLQGYWRQIEGSIKLGNTRYVYALCNAGSPQESFLARSGDGGATWLKTKCPAGGGHSEMAASQTQVSTIYYHSPEHKGVWMSLYGGTQWESIFSPGDASFPDDRMFRQPAADTMIGVAARTTGGVRHDVVYVGGVHLMRTTNNGSSWEVLDAGHGDYCCFALAPGGDAFLIGTHGGVFHGVDRHGTSPEPLNPVLFSPRNRGLGITQFYSGSFSATSNLGVVGGAQDNGTVSRIDQDNWRMGSNSDGGATSLSKANDDIQFGSDQNYSVYWTQDRWQSHEAITPFYGNLVDNKWILDNTPSLYGAFEMDTNGGELYAGTNYLYRYNLQTKRWTRHVGGICLAQGYIRSIKVAPTDPNRLYVGSDTGLWMSRTHGSEWTRIDIPAVGYPTSLTGVIDFISVHPTNPNDILAIVAPRGTFPPSGVGVPKLYRCQNTTATPRVWTELSSIENSIGVARDVDDPTDTLYIAVYNGVMKSVNGGQTWTRYDYGLGLPTVQVKGIATVPATRSLWVTTYGRGFWRLQLPPVVLSLDAPSQIQSGRQTMATISLGRPAQPGGENVRLSTDVPGNTGRRLTIPGGSNNISLNLQEIGLPVKANRVELTVAVGSSSLTRKIDFLPPY